MLNANEEGNRAVRPMVELSTRTPGLPKQDTFMGALLVGCYFAIALYGLISHQMYRYYRMYPNDPKSLKSLVGAVWLLDTLHSVLIMHTCYYYLISNYFSPLRLLDGVWSMQISITLTGLMATIAHIFFSRRVFRITKSLWVSSSIAIVSLACFGFSIATTVITYKEVSYVKFERFTWLACTTLGLNTVADALITVSLCLYLQRCRTGFEKTDSIIDRLLLYVINTGLLNIAYNTAVLICAAVMNDNLIFIGMLFVVSKLYSNSLLAVLNSRRGLIRESSHGSFFHPQEVNIGASPDVYELHDSDVRRRGARNAEIGAERPGSIMGKLKGQPMLDVRITREVHTVSDQPHDQGEGFCRRTSLEKDTL